MSKKFKKVMFLFLVGIMSLAMMAPAYAASDVPTEVYDNTKLPHKTFSPAKINDSSASINATIESVTGSWVADTTYSDWVESGKALSESYTDSTKSTRWPIDRIYAKVRIFNAFNTLLNSAEDEAFHSSVASAVASGGEIWNENAVGNHAFEMAGYQSWYPETYGE